VKGDAFMNFKTLNSDKHYLENKFHNTAEPFNGYQRRNYIAYEYDTTTGLDVESIKAGLDELYASLQDLPRPVLKARMVELKINNRIDDSNIKLCQSDNPVLKNKLFVLMYDDNSNVKVELLNLNTEEIPTFYFYDK
jgi:hypothetical protein